jgi:hypothetical protein
MNVYGKLLDGLWVRELDYKKHFFKKYKGFGFHLHFKKTFERLDVTGCELRFKGGEVRYITSEDWLKNCYYVSDPKPQYIVPLDSFKVIKFVKIRSCRKKAK